MALGSRKREEAFAAMLDDLAVSRAARASQTADSDDDLMGDLVSRLQALPTPAGGMPAEARAKLMAIAAAELPEQAAQRRATAGADKVTAPVAVTPAPRPSPRPRPRPVPTARPRAQARPRVRITDRFSLPSWTPLATGAVAAVVAVTGVGVAVSKALPDNWLHAKSTTSTVRLNGEQSNAALDTLNQASRQMNALVLAAYKDAKAHNGTLSPAAAAAMSSALTDWAATSANGTKPLQQSALAGDQAARRSLLGYTSGEVRSLNSSLSWLPANVKAQAVRDIAQLQAINKALGAAPVATS